MFSQTTPNSANVSRAFQYLIAGMVDPPAIQPKHSIAVAFGNGHYTRIVHDGNQDFPYMNPVETNTHPPILSAIQQAR